MREIQKRLQKLEKMQDRKSNTRKLKTLADLYRDQNDPTTEAYWELKRLYEPIKVDEMP